MGCLLCFALSLVVLSLQKSLAELDTTALLPDYYGITTEPDYYGSFLICAYVDNNRCWSKDIHLPFFVPDAKRPAEFRVIHRKTMEWGAHPAISLKSMEDSANLMLAVQPFAGVGYELGLQKDHMFETTSFFIKRDHFGFNDTVSFESLDHSGHYIYHTGDNIRLEAEAGKGLAYKERASWVLKKGSVTFSTTVSEPNETTDGLAIQ